MCGFTGTVIPRTGHILRHRGPDGIGSSSASLNWAHVAVEMARLAIVDRRQIGVPFDFRESCGVVLAFNGELYNWRELRSELSDGTPWETDCDAEVVARAWRRWGPSMLHRFNAMFGLVIIDSINNEVFLARDRAGEKPLYYAPFGTGLAFASEIKALPIRLEESLCPDVDVFEFDCLETTPFKDVRRLGPGQFIRLRSPKELSDIKCNTWWELPYGTVDENMTWDDAVEETYSLIVDAVKIRSVSEVVVGAQVSGGLDSAIVQAIAKCDKAYTVTFPDDGVDNLPLARLAAGREPTPITFGMADLMRVLPEVVYHLDTPATWTSVCQWFMNKKMAEDGCVVALSGEGADELFGGYTRYRILHHIMKTQDDPFLADYSYARTRLLGTDEEIIARMLDRSDGSARNHALDIVRRFSKDSGNLLTNAMRVEFYSTMQLLMRMADKMAAASSIENRSIFFDYRLMELSARMPVWYKIDETGSKKVLREVAKWNGIKVAPEIINETTKKGLFVPWSKWSGSNSWNRDSFAKLMKEVWRNRFFQAG